MKEDSEENVYKEIKDEDTKENKYNDNENLLKEIKNESEIKDVIKIIKNFIFNFLHKGA